MGPQTKLLLTDTIFLSLRLARFAVENEHNMFQNLRFFGTQEYYFSLI